MTKIKPIFVLSILLLTMLACNALAPTPIPFEPLPTVPTDTQTIEIPLSEDHVKRVSLEDAKAAFDNGTATIVDVRSEQAFAAGHIPGAINIQLGEFETNPTELGLPKDQWIITYCT